MHPQAAQLSAPCCPPPCYRTCGPQRGTLACSCWRSGTKAERGGASLVLCENQKLSAILLPSTIDALSF